MPNTATPNQTKQNNKQNGKIGGAHRVRPHRRPDYRLKIMENEPTIRQHFPYINLYFTTYLLILAYKFRVFYKEGEHECNLVPHFLMFAYKYIEWWNKQMACMHGEAVRPFVVSFWFFFLSLFHSSSSSSSCCCAL